jgi:hypothetical protein
MLIKYYTLYSMYYFILDKIAVNQKKIDNIHSSILHIYCILLLLTSLVIFNELI